MAFCLKIIILAAKERSDQDDLLGVPIIIQERLASAQSRVVAVEAVDVF